MKKQAVSYAVIIIICWSIQCSAGHAADKLQVVVSIPPQVYIVNQIGGECVNVTSMLPPGGFPHTFEPTAKQMKFLSKADLYVRIRIEFEEAWWEKIRTTNSEMFVIDSTRGIDIFEEDGHHREGETMHHGGDPHIWLSPKLVKIQAETIYEGMIHLDPEHQEIYLANKEAFLTKLDELDREIHEKLANLNIRRFMVFHPSWAYFAREYGLEQIPVEIEGKEPSAAEMVHIMKTAKEDNIRVIFVQPQTSRRNTDTIARQIGATVEVLDPLAADWFENMQRVANALAEALK